MQSSRPTSPAAERLAALIDLAREHDDDLNYAEVELLLAASHRRLIIRETPPARPPRPQAGKPRAA